MCGVFPVEEPPPIEVSSVKGSGDELAFNSQKILDSGLREAD
jgi:hypothetical protein